MNRCLSLPACIALGLLASGCPLTDHYELQGELAGGVGSEAQAGGASAGRAGAGSGGNTSGAGSAASAGLAALANAGGSNPACALDLSRDPKNCGACGNACDAGRACVASVCQGGWARVQMPPTAVEARSRAASVAMGKSVFIWGGLDSSGNALDDGAIYTPKSDSWTVLTHGGSSPSARIMATAVWTGSVVVVYGGTDASGSTVYGDGAAYDPLNDSWKTLPTSAAITRRSAAYGFAVGTRVVLWGGLNSSGNALGGADRIDVSNGSWSTASAKADPGALQFAALAADGSNLYVAGGLLDNNRSDQCHSYNAATDSWSELPKATLARSGAFATWDGLHFWVWGGRDDNGFRNDGEYLNGTTWSSLGASGVPSARSTSFRRSGWCFPATPAQVVILGGQFANGSLSTAGAMYDMGSSDWTPIPDWPTKEEHEYGIGIWTGEEFVLWGGRNATLPTSTGERWAR